MDKLKLNDTICFYRKKQGLTQEELAQRLGVTNQSVSKWELAQCYPDISFIPKLADIFEISIDELFGREPSVHDVCAQLPLRDDDTFRVVVARGKKVMSVDDLDKTIDINFPKNCSETTQQYFKVEVYGNICCDTSIHGDVIAHGQIECNQINGDIKECNNISCKGAINGGINANGGICFGYSVNGDVNCGENIACGGGINGDVRCGGSVACGGDIGGDVHCDESVTCDGGISGDVRCGGNLECKTIEGDVECQGNIIYK